MRTFLGSLFQNFEAHGRRLELRVEATDTEPDERGLDPSDNPARFANQLLALPARPLGILLSKCRHRDRLAMSALTAQPAEKAALEKPRVEPIGLRSAMFARHRNARCMNNVSLDALRGEPTR